MEEIVVRDGEVLNASFTDYLIPTMLDMPRCVWMSSIRRSGRAVRAKGVGEPPTISTPPAIVAAVRAATGARSSACRAVRTTSSAPEGRRRLRQLRH